MLFARALWMVDPEGAVRFMAAITSLATLETAAAIVARSPREQAKGDTRNGIGEMRGSHRLCERCHNYQAHKDAKFGMCPPCRKEFLQERAENFRELKARRRARAAINIQQRRNGDHSPVQVMTKPTAPVVAESVVYKTSEHSPGVVPPPGTPERAIYMASFRKPAGLEGRLSPVAQANLLDLYANTAIPMIQLIKLFGTSTSAIDDFVRDKGVQMRDSRPGRAPGGPGHVVTNDDGSHRWVEGPAPVQDQQLPPQARQEQPRTNRHHQLTGEERREIVEAYQGGMTPTEIYRRWNIKTHALYDSLKAAGVAPRRYTPQAAPSAMERPRKNVLTEEQENEVAELYASGVSRKELLETYGIADGSLYRILDEHRVPRNKDLEQRAEPVPVPVPVQHVLATLPSSNGYHPGFRWKVRMLAPIDIEVVAASFQDATAAALNAHPEADILSLVRE